MSNPTNPYAPDEPASVIFAEKTWLQGCVLNSVAYGTQFALFVGCASLLWQRTTAPNRVRNRLFMAYVCVMFGLGTVAMVSNAAFVQFAFITNRDYPGGPAAVENDFFAAPIDEGGNVAFVIQCWLADALLIWRYTVIYRGSRVPAWIVALWPSLILLGSIVTGVLWSIQISATSLHVHASQVVNWTIPFLSLTISLNILVTLAIVIRIQIYRLRLTRILGKHHASSYTGVVAMIVESAAIYSAFAIIVLVTFTINSSVLNIFLQAMSQVQTCTTLLIIYRVAQGRAWMTNTSDTIMSTLNAGTSGGSRARTMRLARAHLASGDDMLPHTYVLDTMTKEGQSTTQYSRELSGSSTDVQKAEIAVEVVQEMA
ncbi:hypothetical protein PsYK624_048560 [Phanerochaete sordida]|uniref:Uncharacterized protein n=1 Tax=Phanerochaete sordida TaxID=48140 RepID=A0A9P3G768_9APHY|nr:hypothetical protein PsYK624_048560 [Phanerochaete sordida]